MWGPRETVVLTRKVGPTIEVSTAFFWKTRGTDRPSISGSTRATRTPMWGTRVRERARGGDSSIQKRPRRAARSARGKCGETAFVAVRARHSSSHLAPSGHHRRSHLPPSRHIQLGTMATQAAVMSSRATQVRAWPRAASSRRAFSPRRIGGVVLSRRNACKALRDERARGPRATARATSARRGRSSEPPARSSRPAPEEKRRAFAPSRRARRVTNLWI